MCSPLNKSDASYACADKDTFSAKVDELNTALTTLPQGHLVKDDFSTTENTLKRKIKYAFCRIFFKNINKSYQQTRVINNLEKFLNENAKYIQMDTHLNVVTLIQNVNNTVNKNKNKKKEERLSEIAYNLTVLPDLKNRPPAPIPTMVQV